MSNNLKGNFCPSPWFHMRITNSGNYTFCRWGRNDPGNYNIKTTTPGEYFQEVMQPIRQSLSRGEALNLCVDCQTMEKHKKISGRQKQLLKIGVRVDEFDKTLASSPWLSEFSKDSCQMYPQDWQIDLGNFCNSACVFCSPESSSRLAAEWKKIGFIDSLPTGNWADDPELVNRFIDTLKQSPHVQYMHFIGGETIITPAFKKILQALIDTGINQSATIGFTTNLSVWQDDIVELLSHFQGLNLGMSVETFSPVNDYVRWPVCLPTVYENLQRWQDAAAKYNWLMQFRTTPTCLTVGKLLSVYDYALANNIAVESCNFLFKPEILKPSVLPMHYRKAIVDEMQAWVDSHEDSSQVIVNTRNPGTIKSQLVQDLSSYINYLKNEPDNSNQLPALIEYLKRIEANRGNSILTYLPEYEELFRTAGY